MKKDFRLIIIIAVQLIVSAVIIIILKAGPSNTSDFSAFRDIAAKLESVGLLNEAIENYELYLQEGNLSSLEKSKIAFSLGELNEKTGKLEKAVKWYYSVETFDRNSGHKAEADKAIVSLLEKLQKYSAANMLLAQKTALNPKQGGKVIAKIGLKELYDFELNDFIDALPPSTQQEMKTPEKKMQVLQAFVADQIVVEHAIKMRLDKDPALRKKMFQVEKQLLVGKIFESEIQTKIKLDEADVENFYQVNKKKYKKPYKDIKEMVKQEYMMEKAQRLYQELVQEKFKTEQVELFPENIK